MNIWNQYPKSYREYEIQSIIAAVNAGECVSVIGLSGAGKSNLMGFLAHRQDVFSHAHVLVDCNRLLEHTPQALFSLIIQALSQNEVVQDASFTTLEIAISRKNRTGHKVTGINRFGDMFGHGAGVADTGGAAVTDNVKAQRLQVAEQFCLVQVVGYHL